MKILNKIPELVKQSQTSYIGQLRGWMEKMKENQVLLIPKSEWKIKTPPNSVWGSYCIYRNPKYTFSGRQDKDNWYLMKVKYPISVEGEPIKRVWIVDETK